MKTKTIYTKVVGEAISSDGEKHVITVVGRLEEGHTKVNEEEPVQVTNGKKTLCQEHIDDFIKK